MPILHLQQGGLRATSPPLARAAAVAGFRGRTGRFCDMSPA